MILSEVLLSELRAGFTGELLEVNAEEAEALSAGAMGASVVGELDAVSFAGAAIALAVELLAGAAVLSSFAGTSGASFVSVWVSSSSEDACCLLI